MSKPSFFSCGSPSSSAETENSRLTRAVLCCSRCLTMRSEAYPSPYTVTLRAMRRYSLGDDRRRLATYEGLDSGGKEGGRVPKRVVKGVV